MLTFILGVASSLIATALFVLFGAAGTWTLGLRQRTSLLFALFRLSKAGVANVYLNRSEYVARGVEFEEYMNLATKEFVYVGVYFSVATDQSRVDEALSRLISKRCKVTIVIMDESTPEAIIEAVERHYALARDTLKGRLLHAREYLTAIRERLSPSDREMLLIRTHRIPILASALLLDPREQRGRMIIDSKWYKSGREQSLGIEFNSRIREGGLFHTVRESYLRIAAESTPV